MAADAGGAFDAVEMHLYAAAARYREGALRGGNAGAPVRDGAIAWMRGQGVGNPAAMAQVFSPVAATRSASLTISPAA